MDKIDAVEKVAIKPTDVMNVLDKFKAPRANLGYKYIIECILILDKDDFLSDDFCKITVLYRDVAKRCKTVYTRVERSIRHEIELIFSNKNVENELNEVFGSYRNCHNKLTNKEFIVSLYYYLTYHKRESESS